MSEVEREFKSAVESIMSAIPDGKIITYGDLAALAGKPRAARIVGGIAHYGNQELPWHRLVNRHGGLASGFHGGREVQKQLLEQEGVSCSPDFYVIEFAERRWRP